MGCGHHGAWLHLQPGQLVPLASAAVNRVIPSETLRWISFGHLEAGLHRPPRSTPIRVAWGCTANRFAAHRLGIPG